MTGGLLELIAIGKEDVYLTRDPEITFFKTKYAQHTNFSIETIKKKFNSEVKLGEKTFCKLEPIGDLISDIWMVIELPELIPESYADNATFSWVDSLGHVIIEEYEININGYTIEKQTGEWLQIWSELTLPENKKKGYNKLIGLFDPPRSADTTGPIKLFIPLKFWFCKNIGLSLPILTLKDQDVYINIKLRNFSECWIKKIDMLGQPDPNINVNSYLLIDYIYLDKAERTKFYNDNHVYLIEQIQNSLANIYPINTKLIKVPLNKFKYPIKELIWVIQREDVLNQIDDNNYDWDGGNDWFNYSNNRSSFELDENVETFDSATLIFNGRKRFEELPSEYFRLIQPLKYHTNIPENKIYTYSFALRPEEYDPSGTCNFSKLQNPILVLNRSFESNIETNIIVKVYAINYNILFISNSNTGLYF